MTFLTDIEDVVFDVQFASKEEGIVEWVQRSFELQTFDSVNISKLKISNFLSWRYFE